MILAGDIGGTKTRLGIFRESDGDLISIVEESFSSLGYGSLNAIVLEFLSRHTASVGRACFGIAGPVQHGIGRTSNLPWIVDAQQLAAELEIENVSLLNDLEATAHGLDFVPDTEIVTLHHGTAVQGNKAIIAAGTGLGEVGLLWKNGRYLPVASEGGHCDFAPGNAMEIGLLQFLHGKYGHVSWERLLSGSGLVNIYDLLSTRHPARVVDIVECDVRNIGAAAVTNAANTGLCAMCEEAVEIFVRLYGAEAGNLALKFMATGGVYVAGGIAAHIIEKMAHFKFETAFADKGRMQPLLKQIPIHVITTNRTALLGAAAYARTAFVDTTCF